jgi:hypothetical protein
MIRTIPAAAGLVCTLAAAAVTTPSAQMSQNTPHEAVLTNGPLRARVYVPGPDGFYRSTRFDWSGLIASLEFQGHNFYGPWFNGSDPSVRDFVYRGRDIVVSAQSAAVGPAEEFRTALGYATAKPGETFVKIGVGTLRKPDEARYSAYANYEVVDPGTWNVRVGTDSVESTQDLKDSGSGYGYVYRKTVRLTKDKPELVIAHTLQNTGRLPIQTHQYNHNFLVLDGKPTSADFTITLPFDITTNPAPDPKTAAVEGRQIRYTKTLEGEDRVFFGITGFGSDPRDYDIRVEDRTSGAAFRVTSDRPLAGMSLWSIRSVISIEPDVAIDLAPGASMDWTLTYTYSVNK